MLWLASLICILLPAPCSSPHPPAQPSQPSTGCGVLPGELGRATNCLQVKLGTRTLLQRFDSLMMIFITNAHDSLDHEQQSQLGLTEANLHTQCSRLPAGQAREDGQHNTGAGRSFVVVTASAIEPNHTSGDSLHTYKQLQQDHWALCQGLLRWAAQSPAYKGGSDAPPSWSCLTSACPEGLKLSPGNYPLGHFLLAAVCRNTEKLVLEQGSVLSSSPAGPRRAGPWEAESEHMSSPLPSPRCPGTMRPNTRQGLDCC